MVQFPTVGTKVKSCMMADTQGFPVDPVKLTDVEVPTWVSEPLSVERSADLAKRFKALADPVRLRLLSLIAFHLGGEICVCHLVGAFDLAQSTISHHLKVLRDAELVAFERRGTWVYYWLTDDGTSLLTSILSQPAPMTG